jgi:hypothetical protein
VSLPPKAEWGYRASSLGYRWRPAQQWVRSQLVLAHYALIGLNVALYLIFKFTTRIGNLFTITNAPSGTSNRGGNKRSPIGSGGPPPSSDARGELKAPSRLRRRQFQNIAALPI